MNAWEKISKGYSNWVFRQVPMKKGSRDSLEFTRGLFVMATTPFILLFLIMDVAMKLFFSSGLPSLLPWTIGTVILILALTPILMRVTREIKLTGSIVNLCIFVSLFVSAYHDTATISFSHIYIPIALVFAVLSLGWRTAFGYLVASLIFSHFLTQRFTEKLQDQVAEISQPIIATALIDLPILCLIAFAIISFYDSHRTKKESEGRQALKKETQKQEKLSRSYRDKALIEMAGGIAHEINNPLFAISGSVEQSLKDPNINQLNPIILGKLKKVKKHSQRIHQLIERLMEFSSIDSNQEDAVDARAALNESLSLNQASLKLESVSTQILGDSPKLQIDLFSLMKIYNSLISNAVFECKTKSFKENWIHFHFSKNEEFGFIDVIDPGTGVSPSVAAKLFNPFFTTREIGQGSGLGLSEARGLARSFKGDISYHLNSGHTCFRISIPLEEKAEEN